MASREHDTDIAGNRFKGDMGRGLECEVSLRVLEEWSHRNFPFGLNGMRFLLVNQWESELVTQTLQKDDTSANIWDLTSETLS